jgi:ParB-like chromosome segregation protein Spo0J
MKVKTIKLSKIKPYEGNPRVNGAAVEKVRESIERFGYQTPIVVDPNNVIIAGHTRYEALRALGWKECEVLVADLPEKLAAEFRIVDNRAAELAYWDKDRLIDELRAVDERADIEPFFADGELNRLFSQAAGLNVQIPTQQQIDQAAEAAATRFEDAANESVSSLTAVTCRHCGKTFHIR